MNGENIAKGMMALGFAVILIVVSQYVQLTPACSASCTSCSAMQPFFEWDRFFLNPMCQTDYLKCTSGNSACFGYQVAISQAILLVGILVLFYGIFRLIW